jgi:competence protein ComEA
LLSTASDQGLNLAALVQDGDQIRVPLKQADTETQAPAGTRAKTFEDSPAASQPGSELIDINAASIDELDQLPGIGPVTAQKIVTYREENGPFATIEAIQDVPGIGPAKFEGMREMITVEGVP